MDGPPTRQIAPYNRTHPAERGCKTKMADVAPGVQPLKEGVLQTLVGSSQGRRRRVAMEFSLKQRGTGVWSKASRQDPITETPLKKWR